MPEEEYKKGDLVYIIESVYSNRINGQIGIVKRLSGNNSLKIEMITGYYSRKGNSYYVLNRVYGWYFNLNEDKIRGLTDIELKENQVMLERFYLLKYRDV